MNKKKFLFIFILFIIITIIFFIIYNKNIYTLKEISLLIESNKLPTNVHIKNETYSDNQEEAIAYTDYYVNDNNVYICQRDNSNTLAETLRNLEKNENISIIHSTKSITKSPITSNIEIPLKETFLILAEKSQQNDSNVLYKYLGKEQIDNKNCIKISFTDNSFNKINVTYFYIDLETNYVVKYEYYEVSNSKDLNIINTETYNYKSNVVTDDDILKFDINNYSDYQYIEE